MRTRSFVLRSRCFRGGRLCSFDLVDDRQQRFQGEPARCPPTLTKEHLCRLGGVCGHLDPGHLRGWGARRFLGLGADDYLRIEARHFECQLLWAGGRHFGVWTEHCDASCDHLAVGAIIVFEGHQYSNALSPSPSRASFLAVDKNSTLQRHEPVGYMPFSTYIFAPYLYRPFGTYILRMLLLD